eukprot:1467665-Pleurochrysis_carterae.AAC.4
MLPRSEKLDSIVREMRWHRKDESPEGAAGGRPCSSCRPRRGTQAGCEAQRAVAPAHHGGGASVNERNGRGKGVRTGQAFDQCFPGACAI